MKFTHLGRDKNKFVDVLATLASMTKINHDDQMQPINIKVRNSLELCCLVEGEWIGTHDIMTSNN